MELGHQNHNRDGLLGPSSTMVVCVDPLKPAYISSCTTFHDAADLASKPAFASSLIVVVAVAALL